MSKNKEYDIYRITLDEYTTYDICVPKDQLEEFRKMLIEAYYELNPDRKRPCETRSPKWKLLKKKCDLRRSSVFIIFI